MTDHDDTVDQAGRTALATGLLHRITGEHPPAFAVLHRPESAGPGRLEVLTGTVAEYENLAGIPLAEDGAAGPGHEVLTLIPYRQLAERGFHAPDDGAPLLSLLVEEQYELPLSTGLSLLPDLPLDVSEGVFDVTDEVYADTVRKIIDNEIGRGEGANFVIRRSFVADISDYSPRHALAFYRRLLSAETGAYWTFIVHTGERTLVGASPERHVSLDGGTAVMNPISGTYRYPAQGPSVPEILDFLADRKEADELYMVVDEELKMMARICDAGGIVTGPHLKEMARLAHTEYFISGRTTRDPREILRETLFAPTVTGSPLESAARVISRYEPQGRGYYSGVLALIGRDERGERAMDSAILIRTAEIDGAGQVRIGVGATLVRHSDPDCEVAETRAKAASLLDALKDRGPVSFRENPEVRAALESRNENVARFWFDDPEERLRTAHDPVLSGKRILVVDAEDTFTSMIDQQLRSLGMTVTVRRFDEPYEIDDYDLVVMGPGPGDPRETGDPKIAHLRGTVRRLLDEKRPFFAVCLSHQVLSTLLGLPLVRRDTPNQGVQKPVQLFGTPELVGFYNTFAARSPEDKVEVDGVGVIELSRDPETDDVHALRGPHFASLQFHAESLLTRNGPAIVGGLIRELLVAGQPAREGGVHAPSSPAGPGPVS
ncbi:anthranilate synthase family protein [Streptomyces sp. NPDC006487]|uniref:anthranilate synthase family protein n=1 Tax=Streptomyces sp. NPDC006487 TaxID=3364748 RepID=UPI0036CB7491